MALGLLAVVPVSADLVYLTSGRALSVKAVRVEGTEAVLVLRAGGEVVCDRRLIDRVAPDEVPYPEEPPVAEPVPAPAAPGIELLVGSLAERHRVAPDLVRAVIAVESANVATARSPRGAMGLMQLMPATARRYAVGDPYDPAENLDAGIRHLSSLLDRYDVRLALAAYNAGEGAVQRYGGMPPYRETRDYVSRVLRRTAAATIAARGRPAPAVAAGTGQREKGSRPSMTRRSRADKLG